jgi:glycosyltransferase involved in cell wall biosynthesis
VNVALHLPVKGLDVLLRAFAELSRPPLTLELIGDGPETPGLRRLADELGMGDRVRFSGRASPPEIAEALRAADVFVLSSHSENMPLALLEALCCGLPAAATDVGGVAEALGDDGSLAPPGDAPALARAIEAVLDDYGRFDREAIAKRASGCFSFEAVGAVWDEIYRQIAR